MQPSQTKPNLCPFLPASLAVARRCFMPDSASTIDRQERAAHWAAVLEGTQIEMQMLVVSLVIQPEACWCAGSTAAVVLWRYSDFFRKKGASCLHISILAYLVTSMIL